MAVGAGLGMGVGVGAGLGMGVGVGAGLGMVGWLVGGVSFGTPVRCTGALSCRHCCFVYLQLLTFVTYFFHLFFPRFTILHPFFSTILHHDFRFYPFHSPYPIPHTPYPPIPHTPSHTLSHLPSNPLQEQLGGSLIITRAISRTTT